MDLEEALVVMDPTAVLQPAAERAAWLAERIGTELELFVCDYDQALSGDRFFDSRRLVGSRASFIERRQERLEQYAAPLRQRGLQVYTDALWDTPLHEGIVRKALRSRPDVVLKDTHHHTLLQRTLFSNTDWQLIRTCPVPLWLVKPGLSRIRRIMAAVDPGHVGDERNALDLRILDAAQAAARACDAELHVMHIYHPPAPVVPIAAAAAVPLATGARPADYEASLAQRHREEVEALLVERDIPSKRVHVELGHVAELLPRRAAELQCDLVVMGAISRSRLHDAFIGGTAERVLEALPSDVLVVKPKGFDPPVAAAGGDQD